MIYLFTWNSEFLVREKTLNWKNQYLKKYWDFNFVVFNDFKNINKDILTQELLSEWFMWEKKLIIIEWFPLSSNEKSSELTNLWEYLNSIIDKIPENNIVVFSSANLDKRSKLYKSIKKIAIKIEEFNTKNSQDIFNIILSKYKWKIDNNAIDLLIRYKAWNLEKIISEIEKLLITNKNIDIDLIKDNIFPEWEESIFELIDDIMNLKLNNAIWKIETILSQVNVYAFYNNFLANIRVFVYIYLLKDNKQNDISKLLDLKNRAFLVNKNYKINFLQLKEFYIDIVNLDKKMKSGKLIWTEEKDFKYELDKILINS